MNASATIRANYVRASRMNFQPVQFGNAPSVPKIQARPVQEDRLKNFKPVNHLEHRAACEKERASPAPPPDIEKGPIEVQSFFIFDEERPRIRDQAKKMFKVFPYRDPIFLVAVIFAVGSLDLVVNAFFDLLPRTDPSTAFEGEEEVAIPTTVLIGSILFFLAGILDTFAALSAERGSLELNKTTGTTEFRPAMLGSIDWSWIPSWTKFWDLTINNLAFQAGLMVLFGGVIFMFGGITDFPGIVSEESPIFSSIVFGPQVIHGAIFFLANVLLAVAEQDKWYKPKIMDAEWQGAFLNAIGGFGFMVAGLLLFQRKEESVESGIAAMFGSWAFLLGSLIRWFGVMEFY
ncbi:hypothetical protein BDV96DRAFT_685838 [Lophiotrema nucula]|uniref:Integral membrane protein n=1 Tax=Lophiotrema nucula TaxID=690887 RepID=A0A6A5ZEK8_9PLEO|nr:hypothetical protein BDV96DRAFT_685838 [Lophiotrema nucula]